MNKDRRLMEDFIWQRLTEGEKYQWGLLTNVASHSWLHKQSPKDNRDLTLGLQMPSLNLHKEIIA